MTTAMSAVFEVSGPVRTEQGVQEPNFASTRLHPCMYITLGNFQCKLCASLIQVYNLNKIKE
jgi:hypothetical protein